MSAKLPKGFDEDFYVTASGYKKTKMTMEKLLEWGNENISHHEIVPSPSRAGNERMRIGEEYKRIQSLMNFLNEIGVKFGTRVGIADDSSLPAYEACFAVPCTGGVYHPINVRLSDENLKFVVNHAEDELLIIGEEYVPRFEKFKRNEELKNVEHFVISTHDGKPIDTDLEPVSFYEEEINAAKQSYEYPELKEEMPAVILHTTGTTGTPKGCWFPHRNITINSLQENAIPSIPLEIEPNYVLNAVPNYHIVAWAYPYHFMLSGDHLSEKEKYCWDGPPDPERELKLIEEEEITTWLGVPTLLYMMLTHERVDDFDLSSLQLVGPGGSASPAGLIELTKEKLPNAVVIVGRALEAGEEAKEKIGEFSGPAAYGMTETWSSLSAWAESKVLDFETGEEVEIGENGEFCTRYVNCTPGYIKDPERSEELWKDGMLHTGDIVEVAEDGSAMVQDRAKDLVNSGGELIPTVPQENIMSEHPKIRNAGVIAAEHTKWGERPVAICEITEDLKKEEEEELKEELNEFLKERLDIPKWHLPEKYVFKTESLPLTSVEKIDKKVLRDKYKDILEKKKS